MQKCNGRIFAASCGLVLVSGCTFFRPGDAPSMPIASVSSAADATAPGDASYQRGRTYQGRMQYAAAIAQYRKSLEEHPANAEAHNALGVIYASLGRHEEALSELKAALALAPLAAHIHNNLGYAYLLSGRNAEAAAALKVAHRLDPGNERVRRNMKSAEQRLGEASSDDPRAPEVVPAHAVVRARPVAAGTQVDPSTPRLVCIAPNVFELRQGSDGKAAPRAAPVRVDPAAVKLEIANGNGVTGLARRTSLALQEKGYAAARLTNQIPYVQSETEIQFRPGEERQARQLKALFAVSVTLVPTSSLSPSIDVRLVLGHDQGQQVVFDETGHDALAATPGQTNPAASPAAAQRSAT